MSSQSRSLLTNVGALALVAGALFFIAHFKDVFPGTALTSGPASKDAQTAAAGSEISVPSSATSSSAMSATSSSATSMAPLPAPQKEALLQKPPAPSPEQKAAVNEVTRIQNPYSFAPESFDEVNNVARAALVNILCVPQGGSLRPISGSGVIIDPRGVILTNAHVAQYVLLSGSSHISLRCFIRTGSPAAAHWNAAVLYIPPIWVQQHAADISLEHVKGTGEHDYALLLITNSLDSPPFPSPSAGFPSLITDTREGIAFLDDQILAASYPAEFLGGLAAQYNLYPASSITAVKQLLTFGSGTIDVLSLGGIIEAQSGSSGGPVLNAWGRLVGIITTTSEGDTTADRDLRAVTVSYIDRDMKAESGYDLATILQGDVVSKMLDFNTAIAPSLADLLIAQIKR